MVFENRMFFYDKKYHRRSISNGLQRDHRARFINSSISQVLIFSQNVGIYEHKNGLPRYLRARFIYSSISQILIFSQNVGIYEYKKNEFSAFFSEN